MVLFVFPQIEPGKEKAMTKIKVILTPELVRLLVSYPPHLL